jgi:hypothetical protein
MKINRKKTISELLDELNYKKYINEDVLKTLKNEGAEEAEIEFFTLGKYASNKEVLKEYEKRNLVPDLGAIITYLIKNPTFLDEKKYIGVQLKDNIFVSFDRWDGGRGVLVDQSGRAWYDDAWFGGRRKSLNLKSSELSETLPSVLPEFLIINGEKYRKEKYGKENIN